MIRKFISVASSHQRDYRDFSIFQRDPLATCFISLACRHFSPYRATGLINEDFKIYCGFEVCGTNVLDAITQANTILSDLPSTLYKSIDYKTTSAMIGAIFCDTLASFVDGVVNPIEKGHPDIIPTKGKDCSEEQLRNYPEGLEVKCTVGNITQGANLRAGQTRIKHLTGITWQAHHQEVKSLLGLVWDFVNNEQSFNFPVITAAFYDKNLGAEDWGKISGTTGRNTKVTGMGASGKLKMGKGWVAVINRPEYLARYTKLLQFQIRRNSQTGLFSQ